MNNKSLQTSLKILLCAIFALLDYYISLYAKIHFKPLFLDTLFEMTAAFSFGPFFGILSVLFKRIWNIIMITDLSRWPGYLYSFCTIFGVIIICLYNKHFLKNEKDIFLLTIKLFLLSMIICFEMSITGGIIGRLVAFLQHTPYSMTVQTDSFLQFFQRFTRNTLVLEIISRIPVNSIDRIITTFIPFFISMAIKKIPVFKD